MRDTTSLSANPDAVISSRLRQQYGPNVADWPAVRLPDDIRDMPPAWYVGIDLDPRHRGEVTPR